MASQSLPTDFLLSVEILTQWLQHNLNGIFAMLHLNFRLKSVKNLLFRVELKARFWHCKERGKYDIGENLKIFEYKLQHWFLVLAVPKFCLWSFPSLCKQDEGNPGDEIHWGRGRAQSNKWVIVYLPPPSPPPPTLSKSYSTDLAIRERSWRPLSSAYSPGSQLKPNKTRNYLKFNFKTTPASQAKQIK